MVYGCPHFKSGSTLCDNESLVQLMCPLPPWHTDTTHVHVQLDELYATHTSINLLGQKE